MNIALLTAGGRGTRMSLSLPKQFMTVNEKPIIIWTAEAFQRHPSIDEIHIVCLEGWENHIFALAHDYGITKFKSVIKGGRTNFESIKNGLLSLKTIHDREDSDIVLVHDGNRPLVSEQMISECLYTTQVHGNAVAVIPVTEVVYHVDDHDKVTVLNRDELSRTQTPHGFSLGEAMKLLRLAEMKGIRDAPALCGLLVQLGGEPGFYNGSERNFKITTQADLEIFKSMVKGERP